MRHVTHSTPIDLLKIGATAGLHQAPCFTARLPLAGATGRQLSHQDLVSYRSAL